jgi:hypothetical protein
MRLRTSLEFPSPTTPDEYPEATHDMHANDVEPDVAPEMRPEAVEQLRREVEAKREAVKEIGPAQTNGHAPRRRWRKLGIRQLIELGKSRKTTQLLLQIWQSDYSIIGFLIMMGTFYLMKDTRQPVVGLTFFLFAMAEVDAILSIFVVRLSFHQNKHGFYRTEDFERDWLRYRMLLSMTKAALLFVVATSCGSVTVVASYLMWFFTSTQRLRYIILRWSMDEHYPELQRWSVFALLREAGIEPKLRNFNVLALLGLVVGYGIVLIF